MADAEETADDYDAKAAEITQQAKEVKGEQEAEQEAMLKAVRDGDEFGRDYEWVEYDGGEFKVKAWFPGSVIEGMEKVEQLQDANSMSAVSGGSQTILDLLVDMTEVVRGEGGEWDTKEDIRAFYLVAYNEFGLEYLGECSEVVMKPAEEASNGGDAMDGFRST